MPKGFLPNADAALLAWSANFSAKLSESGESYGISPAQSAAYAQTHADYAAAFEAAFNPVTRTRGRVADKDRCRAALRAAAGRLSLIVKAQASVTDAQRIDLGLAPRPVRPAPIAPPAAAPSLHVVAVTGRTVRVRLYAADSTRPGKPAGVLGAVLFSHVGPLPPVPDPTTPPAWRFEGHATRTTIDLSFPADLPPGTEVWLTARWLNPRLQSGPAALPINTYLGGGIGSGTSLRLAA